nr:hypothetical protein [Prolixibacteraceae bacterium]
MILFSKPINLIIALLVTGSAFSQTPDTIVVYEYIHVIDTVWMETEVLELENIETAILHFDTLKMEGNIELIYPCKSATIPINHIILSNNLLKLESMKRITLLGLTFLAMNTGVFSQPSNEKNIGVYVRGNTGWQTAYYYEMEQYGKSNAKHDVSIENNVTGGLKANIPINSAFSFSPRLSIAQFKGLQKQTTIVYPDNNKYDGYASRNFNSRFYFLTSDFLFNFYFPIGVKTTYRAYGGLRSDFLVAQRSEVVFDDPNYSNFSKVLLNYVGGVGFDFGKHFFLE